MGLVWALVIACGGSAVAPPSVPSPVAPPVAPPAAPPVVVPPAGRLLVVDASGPAPRVAVVDAAGGTPTPLAVCPGAGFPAAVDPRGELVLAVCVDEPTEASHVERLVVAPLAGGPARVLAGPTSALRNPVWTPDGAWVVYESDEASFRDLYQVRREGGPPQRLTEHGPGQFEPALSPDGARMVSVRSGPGGSELALSDALGRGPIPLAPAPGDDTAPTWSPDGRIVAFLSAREGARRAWTVMADGAQPMPLMPPGPGEHVEVAWSPSGAHVAVVEVVDGAQRVRVSSLRGGPRRYSAGPRDGHLAWSPDGQHVVFERELAGRPTVWRLDLATGAEHQVTTSPAWLPRWLPGDGRAPG